MKTRLLRRVELLRRFACPLVLAIACASRTAAATPAPSPDGFDARRAIFAYDAQAPFALEEASAEPRADATVREISFVGDPRDGASTRVTATLIAPTNGRNHAGILWVHWLGEPATTNRTEFRAEALALAAHGVVSLLVDAMWSQPGWYRDRVLDQDFAHSVRQVVELRRALDLLAAQPGIDPHRLALVGHDYGAMHGIIAAALDPRVKTCVLIAATPSFNDWAFFRSQPASMDDYLRQNAPLELREYAAALAGRAVFMQFAHDDPYVPLAKAQSFFDALREPRERRIYQGAGHEMTAPPQIQTDRTAWLMRELGLEPGRVDWNRSSLRIWVSARLGPTVIRRVS